MYVIRGAPKIHKHKQKPTDIHKQLFMYISYLQLGATFWSKNNIKF